MTKEIPTFLSNTKYKNDISTAPIKNESKESNSRNSKLNIQKEKIYTKVREKNFSLKQLSHVSSINELNSSNKFKINPKSFIGMTIIRKGIRQKRRFSRGLDEMDPKFEDEFLYKQKVNRKLKTNERDFIRKVLSQHFLFRDKGNDIITSLINQMEILKMKPDVILYDDDAFGEYFYIIKEGVLVEASKTNKIIQYYKEGDTLGELALLERRKRNRIVISKEDVLCYCLDGEIFRKIVKTINKKELKERLEFLSLVPIFQFINNNQLNNIATSMYNFSFDMNQKIFLEGDISDSLYIIKNGEVECEKDGVVIRTLKSKDYFGEYAILFDLSRTLTVKAKTRISIYKIGTNLLEDSLGKDYKSIIIKSILKESFYKSVYLKIFTNNSYIDKIYEVSKIKLFEDGSIVFSQNINETIYNHDKLYCILCGDFVTKNKNTNPPKIINVAKRGQLFGENIIRQNERIKNDIYAQGECRVIEIVWDELMTILAKVSGLINDNGKQDPFEFIEQWEYIKRTDLLRTTPDNQLIKICSMMKSEKFSKNEYIFKEGTIGDKFYLIKQGYVAILKANKNVRILEKGNCFGEWALISNKPRSATVQAKEDCILYSLTKSDFVQIFNKNILDYLRNKMALEDNFQMSLDDFYFCKNLGQGKFGSVSLVHNNNNFYAIKAVNKLAAEKQKILIKYFLDERKVLLQIDHTFIMKLVRTFKNKEDVFYLTGFIDGEGLGKYLSKKKKDSFKNKFETQFFIAFLLIILDYLNSHHIVHRDLKPDNMIINTKGYLNLIDFGTATVIKDFTSTTTGTPHYIGPEVLSGKGYSFSCDYWSVGVIAFKIYYDYFPFGNDAEDPLQVYKEVLNKELSLSSKGDPTVNSFIKALLQKKVNKRMCSLEAAKKHPFYYNFNWDDLINYRMTPVYMPKGAILKDFKDYKEKYVDYLKSNKKRGKPEPLLSSYEDEDDSVSYPKNWADQF